MSAARALRPWLLAALLPACGAVPPSAAPKAAQVRLAITFVPALAAPGVLSVQDETGGERQVATRCSGVDLDVAPGPVALRLRADGREWAFVANAAESRRLTWTLGDESR